ncbi:MAG: phosphoglycerate mutase [Acidaminococcaceae bacterium]
MKTLLVIIDGLGDDAITELNGKTPFDYARHENIDKLIKRGTLGFVSICGNDFIADSLGCILRLLGVAQKDFPRNRAYLELLAHNRDISEYEMVLRCNLVSVDNKDGRLLSFNGQGLTALEMEEAAAIADSFHTNIEFMHLSQYRNLLILDKKQDLLEKCIINPPHESLGENTDNLLDDLKNNSLLIRNFIDKTKVYLQKFTRDGIHYMFYPWGLSERTEMKSFKQLHNKNSAVVCSTEIVKGIARAMDMAQPYIAGGTADIDTDIAEKAVWTIALLKEKDFVVTHFNGADEAAHRYDYLGKAKFISRIDKEFFKEIIAKITEPTKVLICGDHVTSSVLGKHNNGKVPVIACFLNKNDVKVPTISSYQDITNFLFEGR